MSPTYDPDLPRTGYDGSEHDSDAEAKESFVFGPQGIFRHTLRLPFDFYDSTGRKFWRCADFIAARKYYSVYIEFKTYLNDQPDKTTAETAYRPPGRLDHVHIAETEWSNSAACNAIVQQAVGPESLVLVFPDEIFKPLTRGKRKGKLPKATVMTLNRLDKHGIFWLKSSQVQGYLRCRDLLASFAAHGFQPQPQEPAQTIIVECRNSEILQARIDDLKAQGYRLKRGSKTERSAVLTLKVKGTPVHPETGDPLHVFHPGPQGLPQHLPLTASH